jgi:ABC-type branched-subunit amino acid transport system substrate-binding protein
VTRRPVLLRAVALVAVGLLALGACSSKSAKKKAAKEKLTLKIGVLFTTSGESGDLAQAALGAANLAVADAKKDSVTIEIVQADYAGDPKLVPKALASLKGKTDAIVVATDDTAVLPALASVTDVPVVHTLLAEGLPGDPNVFTIAPSPPLQAHKIVSYLLEERKYKKIAVISDTTRFGLDGREAMANAFLNAGVTPTALVDFTPGGDVHTPAALAAQRGAQALVVWVASPGEASRIVVDVHHGAYPMQLVLSGNLATATFAKNASAQVTPVAFRDGMLSVGPWAGPWFNLKRIISFYQRFQTENSAQAPVQAAAFYDAVSLLGKVARQKGSVASADVIAGLESTTDFEGAGVPITFTATKHDGLDLDDLAMYGYTKSQDSAGGAFFPDVDTGGGFFTIVMESLALPQRYRFLTTKV